MRSLAIALVVVLPRLATAGPLRGDYAAGCVERAPQTRMPRSIHKVDFCNFTYGSYTLRVGDYDKHMYQSIGGLHDTISLRLQDVVYGDLDGDGRDEAAIVLGYAMVHNTEEAAEISSSTSISIYRLRRRQLDELGSIGADGKVSEIVIGKRVVTVTSGEDGKQRTRRWLLGKAGFTEAAP